MRCGGCFSDWQRRLTAGSGGVRGTARYQAWLRWAAHPGRLGIYRAGALDSWMMNLLLFLLDDDTERICLLPPRPSSDGGDSPLHYILRGSRCPLLGRTQAAGTRRAARLARDLAQPYPMTRRVHALPRTASCPKRLARSIHGSRPQRDSLAEAAATCAVVGRFAVPWGDKAAWPPNIWEPATALTNGLADPCTDRCRAQEPACSCPDSEGT